MDRVSRQVTLVAVAALALACASAGHRSSPSHTAAFPDACGDAVIATLPPDVPAVVVKPGGKKASFLDRSCFFDRMDSGLRAVNGWRGFACTRFMVDADGRASEFAVVGTSVPKEVEEVIRSAVVSCPLVPARDAEGRPAATWIVLPIRGGGW